MASPILHPAYKQLPPSDAEHRRIRDLSRYYCTFRQPPASPDDPPLPINNDSADGGPSLSDDIVLTALVQLGVYRFSCNRAFISLIDGHSQHILSEATASISLRDCRNHLPNDGIYLGVTTLDLVFGVCPHAMKLFTGEKVPQLQNTPNMTATPSRFIVRDFTLEEDFKNRPYVTGWPYFRFYAEVPVYSPAGYVLGSFCVVDDKPRQHFGDAEVSALQEISDAIANHLENVRTVQYHLRSDRLIKGLTDFVKGPPDDVRSLHSNSSDDESHLHSFAAEHEDSSISRFQPSLPNDESLSLSGSSSDESSPNLSTQNSSSFTRGTSISSVPQDKEISSSPSDTHNQSPKHLSTDKSRDRKSVV